VVELLLMAHLLNQADKARELLILGVQLLKEIFLRGIKRVNLDHQEDENERDK